MSYTAAQATQQATDRTAEDFAREVAALNGEISALSAQRMRELQEKEQLADQLEGLLRILPTGVIVINPRGRIDIANPAAITLLAHPELPRLVGQPWGRVIKLAFRPQEHDGHEISLHSGRLVSLDTCALEGRGQLVVINDLTATRHLQAQVSQHQRLASVGRMVASLAHQIRTPLSAAMLYTENLQQTGLTEPQRVRFAEKVQSRLEHLEKQVRDMLVFARGEVRLVDKVCIAELLADLRHASAAALDRQEAELIVLDEVPTARVVCNRDTLVGALCNLINNAIESVGKNAELKLHVTREHSTIRLQLQDNGPGVPGNIMRQLGEPFVTTKASGTGLGLAVVQAVSRAHGGQFTMSNNDQGACATLILPEYDCTETTS